MTIDLHRCRENFSQRLMAQRAEGEALRQQARQAAIAAILAVVPTYPSVTQVYLFGSVTRSGHFHDRSDIDIAIARTGAATYFALWRDLEAACPDWGIDLREINQPSHFSDRVYDTGELIYESQSSPAQG